MSALRRTGMLIAWIAACGDDPASEGHEGPHVDAAVYEGCPDTTPVFELGMQAQGEAGQITAILQAASPSSPMRFLNDWTVSFQSAAGQALADVEIAEARPFMPVHGHDGNVKPMVTREPDGSHRVQSLNLNMRGPWEIQLHVNSASVGADYIVFHVCVVE